MGSRIAIRNALIAVVLATGARVARADRGTKEESPLSHPVLAITAGVEGFVMPELREHVMPGGAWTARLSSGSRRGVRIELAYTGSAQPVDNMQGSFLLGTGVVGLLRINVAPWVSDVVEPMFYVGGGWSRFEVRNRRDGAMLASTDDVLQIPFGFGVARQFGRVILDGRAGFIITSGDDLLPIPRDPSSSRDSAVMHRFAVSVGLGFEI